MLPSRRLRSAERRSKLVKVNVNSAATWAQVADAVQLEFLRRWRRNQGDD
jgi:hypothetical protein